MGGIYAIENKVSGKIYVGSSNDPDRRWYFHLHALRCGSHVNKRLQSAFIKYGEENLELVLIEVCSDAELLVREQYWIDLLDVCRTGYNIATITGRPASQKGKPLTAEHKTKIGAAKKGKKRKPFSDEWKAKLKAASGRASSNSAALKKNWEKRRVLVDLCCVSCCGIKKVIPSRLLSLDTSIYQCRPCYLKNKTINAAPFRVDVFCPVCEEPRMVRKDHAKGKKSIICYKCSLLTRGGMVA